MIIQEKWHNINYNDKELKDSLASNQLKIGIEFELNSGRIVTNVKSKYLCDTVASLNKHNYKSVEMQEYEYFDSRYREEYEFTRYRWVNYQNIPVVGSNAQIILELYGSIINLDRERKTKQFNLVNNTIQIVGDEVDYLSSLKEIDEILIFENQFVLKKNKKIKSVLPLWINLLNLT